MVDHLLGPGGVVGVQTGALSTFPTMCVWCFQASTKSSVLLMCEQEGVRQGRESRWGGRMERWLAKSCCANQKLPWPYVTFWSAGVGLHCRDHTSPDRGTCMPQLSQATPGMRGYCFPMYVWAQEGRHKQDKPFACAELIKLNIMKPNYLRTYSQARLYYGVP